MCSTCDTLAEIAWQNYAGDDWRIEEDQAQQAAFMAGYQAARAQFKGGRRA